MRLVFSLLALAAKATATTYWLSIVAPGTPVHGTKLNAAGLGFYIGLEGPQSYCPEAVNQSCPAGQESLVRDQMSSMAVMVPGGQVIYIPPSGAVSYTQAHSASMPEGSVIMGWFNKTMYSNCAPNLTVVDWVEPIPDDRTRSGGIVLCPVTTLPMNTTAATHQLYVNTHTFNQTACVPAIGILEHGSSANFGAWQYT